MKAIKTNFLVSIILCFTIHITQAQKRFVIHQDNVKPSMIMQYEAIAKKFNEACKKHNAKTSWATATTDDLKYLYITPIEKFAELDENPFADMAKTMGAEFGNMFDEFDKCYDTHTNYTIALIEDLSYMPEGITLTQEGQNYREWFYIYFTPENAKKIREGMLAVKNMYAEKKSTLHYRIYRNGFGTTEEFYLVAASFKDRIDAATKNKANETVLGPERWETFKKVLDYASRFEEYTGEMRPDLAYQPKE